MNIQRANPKTKIRRGMVIGMSDLEDRYKSRELNSTLFPMEEYIGCASVFDGDGRLYVFTSLDAAEFAVKEAKKIGFRTAGIVEGHVFISNADLHRPHINRLRGYDFQREYYK